MGAPATRADRDWARQLMSPEPASPRAGRAKQAERGGGGAGPRGAWARARQGARAAVVCGAASQPGRGLGALHGRRAPVRRRALAVCVSFAGPIRFSSSINHASSRSAELENVSFAEVERKTLGRNTRTHRSARVQPDMGVRLLTYRRVPVAGALLARSSPEPERELQQLCSEPPVRPAEAAAARLCAARDAAPSRELRPRRPHVSARASIEPTAKSVLLRKTGRSPWRRVQKVATSAPRRRRGDYIFLAGHVPFKPDMKALHVGKVGLDFDTEEAKDIAKFIGLELISSIKHTAGDLDKVRARAWRAGSCCGRRARARDGRSARCKTVEGV
eukprot:5879083-Prymnesium_polylepis.1